MRKENTPSNQNNQSECQEVSISWANISTVPGTSLHFCLVLVVGVEYICIQRCMYFLSLKKMKLYKCRHKLDISV